ncbi:MAG: hypothetical protein R2814_11095 [Flavobacteriaceae bacterium]
MVTKDMVLDKIQILITNTFEIPEEGYNFFDGDGKLKKSEIVEL